MGTTIHSSVLSSSFKILFSVLYLAEKGKMSEVRVHASFSVKNVEEFLLATKKMITATQLEEGCVHYDLYKENGSETNFAMIETWTSAANLGDIANQIMSKSSRQARRKTLLQLL